MLTNSYECLAIICDHYEFMANCIRKRKRQIGQGFPRGNGVYCLMPSKEAEYCIPGGYVTQLEPDIHGERAAELTRKRLVKVVHGLCDDK